MSKNSPSDPRVRRSRRWLQDALRALVQEKPYEAITVAELAARAEVNRTTFYQHFRDKDELLESIVADLLARLFSDRDQHLARREALSATAAPPFVIRLFEEVGKDSGFFRCMLGQRGSPNFVAAMVAALEGDFIRQATGPLRPGPAVPPALVARFLALGLVGALTWWLEAIEATSARQAADWSWSLTMRLVDGESLAPWA